MIAEARQKEREIRTSMMRHTRCWAACRRAARATSSPVSVRCSVWAVRTRQELSVLCTEGAHVKYRCTEGKLALAYASLCVGSRTSTLNHCIDGANDLENGDCTGYVNGIARC